MGIWSGAVQRGRCGGCWSARIMLGLALGLVMASAAAAVPRDDTAKRDLPELPRPLWKYIQSGKGETMVRLDWPALLDMPPVTAVVDSGRPELFGKVPVAGVVARLLAKVPVLRSEEVRELWIESGGIFDSGAGGIYARSDVPPGEVRQVLLDAGWWEDPGAEGCFCAPLPAPAAKDYREWLEKPGPKDRDPVEIRRILSKWTWMVDARTKGWLIISASGEGSVEPPAALYRPDEGWELGRAASFPWQDLVSSMDGTVARLVIDIPGNGRDAADAGKQGDSGQQSRQQEIGAIKAEIERLRKAPDHSVTGKIGDALINLSEVDGGVAIDLAAELPGGRGPGAATAAMFRVALDMAALVTSWLSPELMNELMGARIEVGEDRLRGTLVLSQAALMDAVTSAVERQDRIEELQRRLKELEAGNDGS